MSIADLARPTCYAIDFDGTWTTDAEAFAAIASMLRKRGHTVIIVTSRASGSTEVEQACSPFVDGIVFAGREWKKHAAAGAGYNVDVWIDDMPETIGRPVMLIGAPR